MRIHEARQDASAVHVHDARTVRDPQAVGLPDGHDPISLYSDSGVL